MRVPVHFHEREILLAILLAFGLALGGGLMVNASHWWPGLPDPLAPFSRAL